MPWKHGLAGDGRGPRKHPAYARWVNARQKCRNPNHPRFADYGGRRPHLCPDGIWFAAEWDDFERFIEDVGAPPGGRYDVYSLDRVNNAGPYAPGNVRWSTSAQQRANQYREPWPFGTLEKDGDTPYEVEEILAAYERYIASDAELQARLVAQDWVGADARIEELRAEHEGRHLEQGESIAW